VRATSGPDLVRERISPAGEHVRFTGPMSSGWHTQDGFDLRFEWGGTGTSEVGRAARVVVVVDVLRFTTAVEAAVAAGVVVYPYRWGDDSANEFARSVGGTLADGSDASGPSLSPLRLRMLPAGSIVVLPSPNGSTCATVADEAGATVFAACIRNAAAVAHQLGALGGPIAVIACGERWPNGSLRPCLEDFLGAGALLARLEGTRSPEAEIAVGAWNAAQERGVANILGECASARELRAKGHEEDVAYASEVDVSTVVPVLRDGHFVHATNSTSLRAHARHRDPDPR
jgi:2-phosphosulfolactate phosphatase